MEKKEFYEKITEEIDAKEFLQMVQDGKIDAKAPITKYFCYDTFGGDAQTMAEYVIDLLESSNCFNYMSCYPEEIFTKIFHMETGAGKVVICEFVNGALNEAKFKEEFEGIDDEYYIENFIPVLAEKIDFKYEKIDALNQLELQKMVDETEEKYRNGEITYGEMCKKFNWANDDTYKREKIDEILNDLENGVELNEVLNKMLDKQFTEIELHELQDEMEKNYPDIQKKFNEEIDGVMKQRQEEIKKQHEQEKEKIKKHVEELNKETWYYQLEEDEDYKYKIRVFAESQKDADTKEITEEIFNKVVDIGFTEMSDEDDYIYYDYDAYLSLPSRREIEMKLEEVGFKDIKSFR